MKISERIKQVRVAKDLSQKQVAVALDMDQAQFSRIESGKTDPAFSVIEKVAQALGVELSELLQTENTFRDVNTYDKSLVEKLQLLEELEEPERKCLFTIIDGLVSKKRLKDNLSTLLAS